MPTFEKYPGVLSVDIEKELEHDLEMLRKFSENNRTDSPEDFISSARKAIEAAKKENIDVSNQEIELLELEKNVRRLAVEKSVQKLRDLKDGKSEREVGFIPGVIERGEQNISWAKENGVDVSDLEKEFNDLLEKLRKGEN